MCANVYTSAPHLTTFCPLKFRVSSCSRQFSACSSATFLLHHDLMERQGKVTSVSNCLVAVLLWQLIFHRQVRYGNGGGIEECLLALKCQEFCNELWLSKLMKSTSFLDWLMSSGTVKYLQCVCVCLRACKSWLTAMKSKTCHSNFEQYQPILLLSPYCIAFFFKSAKRFCISNNNSLFLNSLFWIKLLLVSTVAN